MLPGTTIQCYQRHDSFADYQQTNAMQMTLGSYLRTVCRLGTVGVLNCRVQSTPGVVEDRHPRMFGDCLRLVDFKRHRIVQGSQRKPGMNEVNLVYVQNWGNTPKISPISSGKFIAGLDFSTRESAFDDGNDCTTLPRTHG
jgi:hypothetical protein